MEAQAVHLVVLQAAREEGKPQLQPQPQPKPLLLLVVAEG